MWMTASAPVMTVRDRLVRTEVAGDDLDALLAESLGRGRGRIADDRDDLVVPGAQDPSRRASR